MSKLSYSTIRKLADIVKQFVTEGKVENIISFGGGRINSTYLVTMKIDSSLSRYLLQNVNNNVFTDVNSLMSNIISVTDHIRSQGGQSLMFLECVNPSAENGPYIYVDGDNNCWRMYPYIEAEVYPCIIDSDDAFMLGEAIADFSRMLEHFDATMLVDTIPDFHNTLKRFETFLVSVAEDIINGKYRTMNVKPEIKFVIDHKEYMGILVNALQRGDIPVGVTHNDPKISNALFSKTTGAPICMIDLDTVMSGTPLYDIGDALRSIANTDSEDAKTTENVSFSIEIYEAFMKGYLRKMNRALSQNEKKLIPYAPIVIGLELGMRFLTDHIQGNVYFKTDYEGQNLERARVQFALVSDIEQKLKTGILQKVLDEPEFVS